MTCVTGLDFTDSLILCDDDLVYLHYNRKANFSIVVNVFNHLKKLTSHPRVTHAHTNAPVSDE